MTIFTLGVTEAEVWTEDSEGYNDFQIVTEVWIEPQCGYVQMPTQSIAMYMHPLQYHQLPDAVSTVITLKQNFSFMCICVCICMKVESLMNSYSINTLIDVSEHK